MRIKKAAKAGREDVGDLVVEVAPIQNDSVELEIKSSVKRLFGKHQEEYISKLLAEYKVNGVRVCVTDNGALDFVIRARLEAALRRAEIIEQ